MWTRRIVLSVVLLVIGAATWRVGMMLSGDAIGMFAGLMAGAAVGIPAAVLVLRASRREAC